MGALWFESSALCVEVDPALFLRRSPFWGWAKFIVGGMREYGRVSSLGPPLWVLDTLACDAVIAHSSENLDGFFFILEEALVLDRCSLPLYLSISQMRDLWRRLTQGHLQALK